jgi:hypothetical protein
VHVWLEELLQAQMMATLIGALSLAAFAQVFVSYCRSLLASARKVELSERVREVANMQGKSPSAEDFGHFMQLVRLCPVQDADRTGVRAIGVYYRLLRVLGNKFGARSSRLAAWAERERGGCSHFAAVVLERCISSNRSVLTQQAGHV